MNQMEDCTWGLLKMGLRMDRARSLMLEDEKQPSS